MARVSRISTTAVALTSACLAAGACGSGGGNGSAASEAGAPDGVSDGQGISADATPDGDGAVQGDGAAPPKDGGMPATASCSTLATLPVRTPTYYVDFGAGSDAEASRLVVSLISFAYPLGLPKEADLVFDARFLRNPHYDPILQPRTGLDPEVGAYIAADPDFTTFFVKLTDLVDMLLPRFVQEGKKYATVTIGCTGGRHRSVYLVEQLAGHLASRIAALRASGGAEPGWRLHVTHRELARAGQETAYLTDRPAPHPDGDYDEEAKSSPVQAQEA